MDIATAIAEIRKRLDEIEELSKVLPKTESKSQKQLFSEIKYWCKDNCDHVKACSPSAYERVIRAAAAMIMECELKGKTMDDVKADLRFRRKTAVMPFIDEFYAKWSSR